MQMISLMHSSSSDVLNMRLITESGGTVQPDPVKSNMLILKTGKIGLKEKSIFIREKLETLV